MISFESACWQCLTNHMIAWKPCAEAGRLWWAALSSMQTERYLGRARSCYAWFKYIQVLITIIWILTSWYMILWRAHRKGCLPLMIPTLLEYQDGVSALLWTGSWFSWADSTRPTWVWWRVYTFMTLSLPDGDAELTCLHLELFSPALSLLPLDLSTSQAGSMSTKTIWNLQKLIT